MDINFLQQTLLALLKGLPLTINLALLSLLGGGVLALLLADAQIGFALLPDEDGQIHLHAVLLLCWRA